MKKEPVYLKLELTTEQLHDRVFMKQFKLLQQQLNCMNTPGVRAEIRDSSMNLYFSDNFFDNNPRNAGRRKQTAYTENTKEIKTPYITFTTREPYKYADVYKLLQDHPVKDVIQILEMKPATFYRHLKTMKESKWYMAAVQTENKTLETLQSIPGNNIF